MVEFFSDSVEVDLNRAMIIVPVLEKILSDHNRELSYLHIIFMTDDELLEINKEFLQHDYYTDIITFNYADKEALVEAELYISVDRVADNAKTQGVDFWTELDRVMIHGTLHLSGFEDETSEEKMAMQSAEDKYLNTLN